MTEKVFYVTGPPGCGKTTWMAEQAARAVEKHGSDRVAIGSFTRAAAVAAAKEIKKQGVLIDLNNVGTLHSWCFRALGNPELAEKHLREWNDLHPTQILGIGERFATDDPLADLTNTEGNADDIYRRMQLHRARLIPAQAWQIDEQKLHAAWSAWKQASGYLDFTDLLERGLAEVDTAPGRPRALFIDEAQDNNPLQNRLVEKWSDATETTTLIGDPDQAIFTFAGADPYAFYNAPATHKLYPPSLRHSHRLPASVHAWATQWIAQIVEREPVEYHPQDRPGLVRRMERGDWHFFPSSLIDAATERLDGGTVAILTSCGFHLEYLKRELRERGLPFHNPFRPERGDWNPLGKLSERLTAFLRPCAEVWGREADFWTGPMLLRWTDLLPAKGIFRRGEKTHLKANFKDISRPLFTELYEVFEDGVLEEILGRMDDGAVPALAWLETHMTEEGRRLMTYPMRVVKTRGAHELFKEPRLIIGTGHSIKGGEADTVIVCPDLSSLADMTQTRGGQRERDALIRLFYVMGTRARETLLLARPMPGGAAIQWLEDEQ